MVIYNKIVNDKVEFVNEISDLLNNAIEKKEFENLKDDSCICDVKIKGYNKYNKEKNSAVKRKGCKKDSAVKRKGCKEDNKEKDSVDSENNNNNNNNNSNNVDNNNNNDNNNDNDNDNNDNNDNLINTLLYNSDKLTNFSDNILNNLISIAKLKKKSCK